MLLWLSLPLLGRNVAPASAGGEKAVLDSLTVENLYLDVQLALQKRALLDSTTLQIFHDGEQALVNGNWLEARILFELVLEALTDTAGWLPDETEAPDPGPRPNPASSVAVQALTSSTVPRWQLRSEVGYDYSVQNFDANLLEADSTFSEQYRLPYWGLMLDQTLPNQMTLFHRLRINSQLLDYSVSASREVRRGPWQHRLEAEGQFYRLADISRVTQVDTRARYSLFGGKSLSNVFRLDAQLRRKWTLSTSADSIYGNLWAGSVLLAMEHHIGFDQQLGLELTPEFYQEDQLLGQTYQQIASRAYYCYYGGFNRNFEAEVDVAYRRFESRLNGDRYRNRYFAVRPALQAELPLTGNWGVAAEVEYEQRWHEEPSEVSPDFGHGKIRTLVKYYIEDFKSFGLGMVGEKQTFSAQAEASRHFVQQGNFVARGVVAEAEVMNLTGRMLNLTYEVEWRDFPNAETSIFDTFYSNRLVHSISGFAWIPIQQRWQLQFFVNYTNDLDREKSNNDSNNTVFSIGLIYKF